MRLREFMILHRDEIVAACQTELQASDEAGSLARYVARYLEDLPNGPGLASSQPAEPTAPHELLGAAPAIARLRFSIDQLSRRSRAPVAIIGELGTGKRHCARALHAATYPDGELFELDSASRLQELERRVTALRTCTSAESTAGVTIYVHEVSEAPGPVQLRLSQLLPEQGLRCRVIASSSRPLSQAARDGSLRSDLVFRFPTVLELPPLRDRTEDIPALTRHFSALVAARHGAAPTSFDPSAFEQMAQHDWPGNLTELSNLVERLWQDFGPARIGREELPELGERQSGAVFHLPPSGIDFAELERELLTQALTLAGNNQTRAASLLGLTRDQLRYRLAKFDIALPSVRSG